MSNVPAAVRRQVKEAARQQAAVQAGQDPFAGAPPPAPQPPPPQGGIVPMPNFAVVGAEIPPGFVPVDLTRGDPRVAPPAAAPAQQPQSRWMPASQGNQPPPQPAQQPTAAAPPPGAQPVVANDHKYNVLQGKYNKEIARKDAQVEELLAQNREMLRLLAQRSAAPALTAPAALPQTPRERALAAGFSEKEIEEFGEDLVAMMVRTASNVAGPQLAALKQENARLASQVQNTVQSVSRNASDRFWEDLAEMVPSHAAINASQEWLDWLQQPELFSGRPRNEGLQNAFNAHDARRVAGIMNAFVAEDARAPTAGSRIDPATLVAPGQPAASTPAPAGGNNASVDIWTEDQVRSFYSDVRRGRIKGADKARVEAEINKALVEGRIKPEHNDAYLINSR